jgi:hypothetical protein
MTRRAKELSRFGRAVYVVMAEHGIRTERVVADLMNEAGYETSQQSVSNYLTRRTPPTGWFVGFVQALGLDAQQQRRLLRAYLDERPDLREFLDMWASDSVRSSTLVN